MKIGPDGQLYAIVGEMQREGQLQNFQSGPPPDDTGVIFRISPTDGSPAPNNPFSPDATDPLSKYYAYGIHNSFGIDFDPVTGKLWDAENGEDVFDEINVVNPGFNSGWHKIMGPTYRDANFSESELTMFKGAHYSDPVFSWKNSIGVTDIEFFNSSQLGKEYSNNLFVGDINNGNLYFFKLNDNRTGLNFEDNPSIVNDLIADKQDEVDAVVLGTGFGGITNIETGPDGNFYILSYQDGRIYR